jgi:hypothetical protein
VGFGRLRAAVRPDAPSEVCRWALHDLVGGWRPDDDIAIMAIRRSER